MEAPMEGTIQLQAAYSVKRPPRQFFEKRAAHHQPHTPAPLIATLLLSVALWLGIWGVVTSLVSLDL
jgi:hypothetical protein